MDALIPAGFFRTAYLLGAAQGIFLAAVLASRRRNALPNRLLAIAMLVFSIDLAMGVYHSGGLYQRFPAFIGLDYPLTLLYGPVIYLYVRTLSAGEHTLRRTDLLHGIPFLLVLIAMIPFYAQSGASKLAVQQAPEAFAVGRFLTTITPLKIVQALAYVALTIYLVQRHQQRIRDAFSATEHVNLIWLRNLVVAIVFLAALSTVFYLLERPGQVTVLGLNPDAPWDDLTLLSATIFVYAIGYLGLRQPEILPSLPSSHRSSRVAAQSALDLQTAAQERDAPFATAEKPRYAKSGMDTEMARTHLEKLLEVMEEQKLYRRGDLTLQDLADALGISAHNLTEVINTQTNQSFYDFVNGYRVREVQERLKDPQSSNLTLLAIGLDAGFQSKSSFNAAFKRRTGMTPSAYRQRVDVEA